MGIKARARRKFHQIGNQRLTFGLEAKNENPARPRNIIQHIINEKCIIDYSLPPSHVFASSFSFIFFFLFLRSQKSGGGGGSGANGIGAAGPPYNPAGSYPPGSGPPPTAGGGPPSPYAGVVAPYPGGPPGPRMPMRPPQPQVPKYTTPSHPPAMGR